MKTVDVVLASYNGDGFVAEQIKSILINFDKIYKYKCSLLISDDLSTDQTKNIIEEFCTIDNRVKLIDYEKKGGVRQNFLCLMNVTNADYVFFCDQDDFWLPNKIQLFLERFHSIEDGFDGPILIHSDLCVADQNLSPIHVSMFDYQNLNKKPKFESLIVSNSITGCVMACNKSLIDKVKHSSIEKSIMHDWYLGLYASAMGRVDFIDKALILYRQHQNNQVGAKEFGLFKIIRSGSLLAKWESARQSVTSSMQQATVFYDDFSAELDINTRNNLRGFILSFNSTIISRLNFFALKGFRKRGFIRNIIFFLIYVLKM